MKRNIGRIDRFIRMTIAVLLVLGILSNYILGNAAIAASIVAVLLGLTSILGHSPIYSILKASTKE